MKHFKFIIFHKQILDFNDTLKIFKWNSIYIFHNLHTLFCLNYLKINKIFINLKHLGMTLKNSKKYQLIAIFQSFDNFFSKSLHLGAKKFIGGYILTVRAILPHFIKIWNSELHLEFLLPNLMFNSYYMRFIVLKISSIISLHLYTWMG